MRILALFLCLLCFGIAIIMKLSTLNLDDYMGIINWWVTQFKKPDIYMLFGAIWGLVFSFSMLGEFFDKKEEEITK